MSFLSDINFYKQQQTNGWRFKFTHLQNDTALCPKLFWITKITQLQARPPYRVYMGVKPYIKMDCHISITGPARRVKTGSTLYSEGWFVRRFFSPKPLGVPMLRRTYGPKVLYSEVPLVRRLLCSDDFIFRKLPIV